MALFGFALGFEARTCAKLISPTIKEQEFEVTFDAKNVPKSESRNNYETQEPENKNIQG